MSSVVPEGWEETNLRTLVSVDIESLKGNTDPEYKFKYIDISCVSTGSVTPPSQHILFQNAPSRAKRVVRQNDVLIATVRPNLKAFAHFDEEGDDWVASTGFAVLRNKEWADSRFIFNVMLSDDVSGQIDKLVAGSNYPAINSSDVKDLTVLSPPLPEQKKIASILTSVDEVIENTQKQIDKLQDLKKATMNELLTKGIGHTEFKDSELGRIPKSWEVRNISQLADVRGGKRLPKGRPFSDKKTPYPYIRISDFENGTVSTQDIRYVLPVDREQIKRYTISDVDICVSIAGIYLGLFVEIPSILNNALLTENAAKLVFHKPSTINKPFFKIMCQSEVVQKHLLQEKGVGGGVPKLALFRISETPVPLPPKSEQDAIAEVLNGIQNQILQRATKLAQIQSLKKSLMQDLLTGKVRVTVN